MLKRKSKKAKLDLNNDGVFDKEDKAIAGQVLASKIEDEPVEEVKEEVIEVPKEEGKIALVDISRKFRKGHLVPQEQIEKWKSMGIDISAWF